jgi:hypothetical protein
MSVVPSVTDLFGQTGDMAEKDALPLDYLTALPTDGGKARPPMPDDGKVYEWDVDFGWIEAPLTQTGWC